DQLLAVQNADWKAWGALAYIVLASSIVAYYLWYRLIARLKINQVVPYTLLAPVIGVAAGVLILGEVFTVYKVFGGSLTIAGIALIQFRQMHSKKAPE
ncbi:MAG: DMT family transporter, partial [Gammaproteobacteria bacterium]|nr:DMT family transporter [Gammaproteobacteria bacterium]